MDLVNVKFDGKLLAGFTKDLVTSNLRNFLKLSEREIEKILAITQEVSIKKGISAEVGEKYVAALRKCGLNVSVERETPDPGVITLVSESASQSSLQSSIRNNPIKAGFIQPPESSPLIASANSTAAEPSLLLIDPEDPALLRNKSTEEASASRGARPHTGHQGHALSAAQQHQTVSATAQGYPAAQKNLSAYGGNDSSEANSAAFQAAGENLYQQRRAQIAQDYYQASDEAQIAEIPPYFSLSMDGRYGRLNYINAGVFAVMILFLGGLFIGFLPFIGLLLIIPFLLAAAIYQTRVIALRLQDLNYPATIAIIYMACSVLAKVSRNESIIMIMDWVSLIFLAILTLVPGNKNENEYGPPSEQGGKWGLVLTIIFIVLGVVGVMFVPESDVQDWQDEYSQYEYSQDDEDE